jgi:hypothetical protein
MLDSVQQQTIYLRRWEAHTVRSNEIKFFNTQQDKSRIPAVGLVSIAGSEEGEKVYVLRWRS